MVVPADAQAVVVPVASAVEAADSKNKYEVQKCTSYSFVHTFNEMPFMSDNANIDEDIKNKEWRYDEKRIRKSA